MSHPMHAIVFVSAMPDAWCALSAPALQTKFQEMQRRLAERHRERDITGLLICGGGHFLAWLEGEETQLRVAISRLQQENPNQDQTTELRVIHDSASDRVFADWSLCVLNQPDAQGAIGQQIHWLLACDSQHLQRWSRARMLRSVIKPPRLFQANQRFRRVGLFGTSSRWISSFLAYLSFTWGRPLVRTQVLHGEGLQSESVLAYLDVDHPSLGPLRWVNYASGIWESELKPLLGEQLSLAVLFQTQPDIGSALAFNAQCLDRLASEDSQTAVVAVVGRASLEHMPAVLLAFDNAGRRIDIVRGSIVDNAPICRLLHDVLSQDPRVDSPTNDRVCADEPLVEQQPASAGHSLPLALAPNGETNADWLAPLLTMESLEAVRWRAVDPADEATTGARGGQLVVHRQQDACAALDWFAILQTQEEAWNHLEHQAPGEPLEQMLVRCADRLALSCRWPAQSSGVLSVITRSGWVNEVLLRTQLRDHLAALTPPPAQTVR